MECIWNKLLMGTYILVITMAKYTALTLRMQMQFGFHNQLGKKYVLLQ